MVQYTAIILKFEEKGDKTGWTYIEVPADIAQQLMPDHKKSFRVKGLLDNYSFSGISLLPMGGGNFIMALNATTRKHIGKRKGATVQVRLQVDHTPIEPPRGFMECLEDEPGAMSFFSSLAKSHQNYFIKWIDSAKTEQTKTKRMAQAVNALSMRLGYGEMIRMNRKNEVPGAK